MYTKHCNSMKNQILSINLKLFITVLFLFSLSVSHGQNYVLNGSFENSNPLAPPSPTIPANSEFITLGGGNTLTNWNHLGGIVDVHHSDHWSMGVPAGGGNQHLDLNGFGSVSQDITGLTPGLTYNLTFFTSVHALMNCQGSSDMDITIANLNASLALTVNDRAWTQRSFIFTASSATETLTFSGDGSCYGSGGVLVDLVEITVGCNPECQDEDWVDVNTGLAPISHFDQAYRIGNTGIGTFNPTWNFKLTVDNTNGTGAPNNSRNAIRAKALHDDCTFGYGVLIETNPLGGTRALAVQGSGSDRSVLFGNGMAWFSNRVNIGGPQPLDVCSDDISDPILVVNGSGTINGMNINSDSRFKKDITPIENSYSLIERLNPVTYSYKTNEFKDRNFSDKPIYGFIAQEIKEVLPNVVRKERDGYYSVNYIAVIPILTQAIKEQQQTIKALEEKVAILAETNKTKGSFDAVNPTQKEAVNTGALLFQNNPNPLNNVTFIDYFLPENTQSAFVKVIDNNGKLVKAFPVNQTGYGQLELDCTNLQSGIYYYSLIVDKQVIDTLKMVVAKD